MIDVRSLNGFESIEGRWRVWMSSSNERNFSDKIKYRGIARIQVCKTRISRGAPFCQAILRRRGEGRHRPDHRHIG